MVTTLARSPKTGTDGAAPDRRRWARGHRVRLIGASVALPVALFAVLQPETYGLTPNGLDPIFYSALAVNFDDAGVVGAHHYFISRWSSWYLLYLANLVAGPIWGRMLVRLVLVSAVLLGLWSLRPRWSWAQRIVSATVLLTLPMFIRPLLTDYVEWTVLLLGMLLVLLALRARQTWWTALAAGVLVGLLVVANPFALTAAVPPLVVMGLFGVDGRLFSLRGMGNRLLFAALVGVAVVAVAGAGLLYFRWFYGVDNIYSPTVTFLRNPPGPDLLKSPTIEWLTHFTWLFLPPLVIAVALLAHVTQEHLDRTEWLAVAMAGAHYLIQWADQFGRNGSGLEISYYWSMSFCSLGIALALLTGRLVRDLRLSLAAAAIAAWLALLVVGVPDALRLPSGIEFGLISTAVVAVIALVMARVGPLPGATVFLVYGLWIQIGAPPYDPSAYHPYNVSPRYDKLFWGDGDQHEAVYREALWFTDVLDRLPDDNKALFYPVNGWAGTIEGMYHAHVGQQQLVRPDPETQQLSPLTRYGLVASTKPLLVLLGDPALVQDQLDRGLADLRLDPPILDETHRTDLGYRVVAVPLHPTPRLPFTFEAEELPVQTGLVEPDDVVFSPGDRPGFITFGPYVLLSAGRYEATVTYRAAAPDDEVVGQFDAFSNEPGQVAATDMPGTGDLETTVTLTFDVEQGGELWELRTLATSSAAIAVDKIELDAG